MKIIGIAHEAGHVASGAVEPAVQHTQARAVADVERIVASLVGVDIVDHRAVGAPSVLPMHATGRAVPPRPTPPVPTFQFSPVNRFRSVPYSVQAHNRLPPVSSIKAHVPVNARIDRLRPDRRQPRPRRRAIFMPVETRYTPAGSSTVPPCHGQRG